MIRRVVLLFGLLSPILMVVIWPTSPLAAFGTLFVSHMLILYPTLSPSSQWWGRVVTHFATREKEVWITIDDGPAGGQTEEILDLLDEFEARATFFVKGKNVRADEVTARMIVERGNEIANHSDLHPSGSFWLLGRGRIAREIDGCAKALENIGVVSSRFRSPVGMKNFFVHPLLRRRNMTLIGWNVRAFDGVGNADPLQTATRVVNQASPGAIIVLHEGRAHSPALLRSILEQLTARGYRAVIPRDEQLLPREREEVVVERSVLP